MLRRICRGSIKAALLFIPLPIPLILLLAKNVLLSPVQGWSQPNLVKRCFVGDSISELLQMYSRRQSLLVNFQTMSSDHQPGYFEDSSKFMDNLNNTTAIASENKRLRDSIRILQEENEVLKQYVEQYHQKEVEATDTFSNYKLNDNRRIVLETFEGEGLFDSVGGSYALVNDDGIDDDELWCDVLDGDECPIEPSISFGEALRDRAYWLVGLLIMQSLSGIILSRNELLLANHPVIIYYLTMMVGAGGNAGNQASVRGKCEKYCSLRGIK